MACDAVRMKIKANHKKFTYNTRLTQKYVIYAARHDNIITSRCRGCTDFRETFLLRLCV